MDGQTTLGYSTGLLVGYLWSRTWKLVTKTREIETDYMELTTKLRENEDDLADNALSVQKRLEKHAETLDRYFEAET